MISQHFSIPGNRNTHRHHFYLKTGGIFLEIWPALGLMAAVQIWVFTGV
jgi:hypothetical protein